MQAPGKAGAARLAVLILLLVISGCGREQKDRPESVVDPRGLAPDFIIGQTPQQELHLRALRGKVVVLSFSIRALDEGLPLHTLLTNISRIYPTDVIRVIEIDKSLTTDGTAAIKPDTSFWWVPAPKDVFKDYKVKRLPTIVVLDTNGREVFRHEGFHPQSTGITAFKAKVAELLRM